MQQPKIMQNWILLALLERKVGRTDNCMQICEQVISMDPNNETAYEIKGDLFKYNARIEEAFIQYSRAIQCNPESSSAISRLGDVLKFKGRLREALDHYQQSLKLNINQPATLMALMNTKLSCCDWSNYD
jgi:tetratricopeptide (TPR) repeat protein